MDYGIHKKSANRGAVDSNTIYNETEQVASNIMRDKQTSILV